MLSQHGVSQKDMVARQIARLDIAAGWVLGRRSYGDETKLKYIRDENASGSYLSMKKLLSEDLSITCAYAATSVIYIVREMEKKSPTGLTVGGLFVFKARVDGKTPSHNLVGAVIALPSGEKANLYYDPTPVSNLKNPTVFDLVTKFGPTSRVGLEFLANDNSVAVLPDDKRMVGAGARAVTYNYPLFENWGGQFALGNFNSNAVPSYGDYTGGYTDYIKGVEPFKSYKLNNQNLVNFENILRQEFQKF